MIEAGVWMCAAALWHRAYVDMVDVSRVIPIVKWTRGQICTYLIVTIINLGTLLIGVSATVKWAFS